MSALSACAMQVAAHPGRTLLSRWPAARPCSNPVIVSRGSSTSIARDLLSLALSHSLCPRNPYLLPYRKPMTHCSSFIHIFLWGRPKTDLPVFIMDRITCSSRIYYPHKCIHFGGIVNFPQEIQSIRSDRLGNSKKRKKKQGEKQLKLSHKGGQDRTF